MYWIPFTTVKSDGEAVQPDGPYPVPAACVCAYVGPVAPATPTLVNVKFVNGEEGAGGVEESAKDAASALMTTAHRPRRAPIAQRSAQRRKGGFSETTRGGERSSGQDRRQFACCQRTPVAGTLASPQAARIGKARRRVKAAVNTTAYAVGRVRLARSARLHRVDTSL